MYEELEGARSDTALGALILSLALSKSPGQSVLSTSLSNSPAMAREEREAIILHLPSRSDVCAEHYSGEVFLPTLPAPFQPAPETCS